MPHERRTTAVAVVGGLAALVLAAPPPPTALRSLSAPVTSADPTGPLVAAVALLAWVLAGWLGATAAVVLLSRVPGLVGRLARGVVRRVAPGAVRRAVEAALGLTVAVGSLGPTAALAGPVPTPTAAVVGVDHAWDLDWPSATTAPGPGAAPSAPAPPTAAAPAAAPPPRLVTPAPVRASPAAPAAGALVVRAGDSLWSLAEASLRSAGPTPPSDRQVAQAWPRWWAANREAIGDDPDLLLPGTVLRPPAGTDGRP